MNRPLALLLGLAAVAILAYPSSAGAIPIHVHKTITVFEKVGRSANGPLVVGQPQTFVQTVNVAPGDDDDDGCRNAQDSYDGPGCNPPAPEPVAAPVIENVAPTPEPAPTSVPPAPVVTGSASAIPSYITACESGGDYSAVNPSSGAYGAYQIMPSTASSYGCDLSTASGQDQCAAAIYADVGSSAWSCG